QHQIGGAAGQHQLALAGDRSGELERQRPLQPRREGVEAGAGRAQLDLPRQRRAALGAGGGDAQLVAAIGAAGRGAEVGASLASTAVTMAPGIAAPARSLTRPSTTRGAAQAGLPPTSSQIWSLPQPWVGSASVQLWFCSSPQPAQSDVITSTMRNDFSSDMGRRTSPARGRYSTRDSSVIPPLIQMSGAG